MMKLTRRACLAGAAALGMTVAGQAAFAEGKSLTFSSTMSEQDIRGDMARMIAEGVEGTFDMDLHFNGSLFKQGTELVALQRGNLDLSDIPPQDIANQLPEFSIISSAYLFRDAEHLFAFFDSDVGQDMLSRAEEKLGVKFFGPVYNGARQLGMRIDKEITTPADMDGVRLRMPGGTAWQMLGQSLGANPTAMPYAEVYTGLQTGAIDGQDNPLANVRAMKFYEVMDQIVLTSHVLGYTIFGVSARTWESLSAEEQQVLEASIDEALAWNAEQQIKAEQDLIAFMQEQGLKVSTPDVEAFRAHAQEFYLNSDLSKDWPEGLLEAINGL